MNIKKVRFKEDKIKILNTSEYFDIWTYEDDYKVFVTHNNSTTIIPKCFTKIIELQLVESHFLLIHSDNTTYKINLLTGLDQLNVCEQFSCEKQLQQFVQFSRFGSKCDFQGKKLYSSLKYQNCVIHNLNDFELFQTIFNKETKAILHQAGPNNIAYKIPNDISDKNIHSGLLQFNLEQTSKYSVAGDYNGTLYLLKNEQEIDRYDLQDKKPIKNIYIHNHNILVLQEHNVFIFNFFSNRRYTLFCKQFGRQNGNEEFFQQLVYVGNLPQKGQVHSTCFYKNYLIVVNGDHLCLYKVNNRFKNYWNSLCIKKCKIIELDCVDIQFGKNAVLYKCTQNNSHIIDYKSFDNHLKIKDNY